MNRRHSSSTEEPHFFWFHDRRCFMRLRSWSPVFLLAGLALPTVATLTLRAQTPEQVKPLSEKSRSFDFTYAGKLKDLPPGKSADVWLPVATSNALQEVSIKARKLPKADLHKEPE